MQTTFKQLRETKGLKQAEVAKYLKVHPATLCRFENGLPNKLLQIKLARFYGRPDLEPTL